MALFWMVATVAILASFLLIVGILIMQAFVSRGSASRTSKSNNPRSDEKPDIFGRKLGNPFYGHTVNDVTVLSEMERDSQP